MYNIMAMNIKYFINIKVQHNVTLKNSTAGWLTFDDTKLRQFLKILYPQVKVTKLYMAIAM